MLGRSRGAAGDQASRYNRLVEMTVGAALARVGSELARIFLPSWCVACGSELAWRDRVGSCCGPCWRALPRIDDAKCDLCARPLAGESGRSCLACQAEASPLVWCEAWGEYRGGLESVLHAFKFGRHDFLAEPLAQLAAESVRSRDTLFDAVVPVPMTRAKQRRRGYNQAALLARELASQLVIPCKPHLLARTAEKETQSTLPRERRAANVRGVFSADRAAGGLSILVVDDITTTGETLRACARELRRRGAAEVYGVAVAKVR